MTYKFRTYNISEFSYDPYVPIDFYPNGIRIVVSGVEKGSGWLPWHGEPPNGEHLLTRYKERNWGFRSGNIAGGLLYDPGNFAGGWWLEQPRIELFLYNYGPGSGWPVYNGAQQRVSFYKELREPFSWPLTINSIYVNSGYPFFHGSAVIYGNIPEYGQQWPWRYADHVGFPGDESSSCERIQSDVFDEHHQFYHKRSKSKLKMLINY
jgi:hypothetical protein